LIAVLSIFVSHIIGEVLAMNQDDQKNIPLSTIPKSDAAVLTTKSSAINQNLTDSEIASVAGTLLSFGPKPPHVPPK
jgi:hypothetical protein